MKHTIKYFAATVLTIAVLMLGSCTKDFDTINRNPYFSTVTTIGPLFNTVVESLKLGWNEQFYVHNEVLYGQTQLAALTREAWSNLSLGSEEIWKEYYRALAHIRDIEARITAMESTNAPDSLNNVKGMLKILTAYKTFRVTDLFGDIPFFEAGRGFQGLDYLHPAYDSQQEIYLFLLDELKWATDNMSESYTCENGSPMVSIAGYDKLFDGDIRKWKKFANSLRLRHAMRISRVAPEKAGKIIQTIIEGNLPVIEEGEDVVMMPRTQNWLKESTNWSFREHKNLRMGSNFWHAVAIHDSLDGSGIQDPRAYLFYETNNSNQWVAFPQCPDVNTPPSGGMPYQLHRDVNYTIKGNDCIYSPFNYYLIRDENDIPEIILTAAEYYFIKAEAYFYGIGVTADENLAAGACFEGVIASLTFWNTMKENSAIWLFTAPGYETLNPYDLANQIFFTEDKATEISKQRWLDLFRQPWEAYALCRRTENTPREGEALTFLRLPYPPSESEYNSEQWALQTATMGGDLTTINVWWDQ